MACYTVRRLTTHRQNTFPRRMDQHSHLQLKKNFKLVKTAEVTRVGYSDARSGIGEDSRSCDNHLTSLQIPGSTCRLGRCLLTGPAPAASFLPSFTHQTFKKRSIISWYLYNNLWIMDLFFFINLLLLLLRARVSSGIWPQISFVASPAGAAPPPLTRPCFFYF